MDSQYEVKVAGRPLDQRSNDMRRRRRRIQNNMELKININKRKEKQTEISGVISLDGHNTEVANEEVQYKENEENFCFC